MDNITDQIAFSPTIMDLRYANKPVSKTSSSGLRHLDPETDFKVRRIVAQVNETAHIAANEPSMGLYRIQEHVHRTLPQLVLRKTELKTNLTHIEDASYDLNLSVEVIDSISHIPHFKRIHEALKTAIDTKRKLNLKEDQEQARLQLDVKNAERANRSLSQNEPAEGYICPICLVAMASQDDLIKHWQQNHSIQSFENDCIEEVALPEITGKAEGTSYVVKQENDMAVIDIEKKPRFVSECEDVVKSFVDEDEIDFMVKEVNEETASSASSDNMISVDKETSINVLVSDIKVVDKEVSTSNVETGSNSSTTDMKNVGASDGNKETAEIEAISSNDHKEIETSSSNGHKDRVEIEATSSNDHNVGVEIDATSSNDHNEGVEIVATSSNDLKEGVDVEVSG